MELQLHDILELKKDHPCGSRLWEVLRVGMDIKIRCLGCGHEVMQPRRRGALSSTPEYRAAAIPYFIPS